MIVEPQAADDPIKAAQQEIKDLEEILPDIRGKVKNTMWNINIEQVVSLFLKKTNCDLENWRA